MKTYKVARLFIAMTVINMLGILLESQQAWGQPRSNSNDSSCNYSLVDFSYPTKLTRQDGEEICVLVTTRKSGVKSGSSNSATWKFSGASVDCWCRLRGSARNANGADCSSGAVPTCPTFEVRAGKRVAADSYDVADLKDIFSRTFPSKWACLTALDDLTKKWDESGCSGSSTIQTVAGQSIPLADYCGKLAKAASEDLKPQCSGDRAPVQIPSLNTIQVPGR